MKRIEISLGIILFGWGSLINGNIILSSILFISSLLFMFVTLDNINYYRLGFISLLTLVITLFTVYKCHINELFNNVYLIIVLNSICFGLLNECVLINKHKEIAYILLTYIIGIIVSYVLLLTLDNSYFISLSKEMVFIILNLILLPYILSVSYNTIKCEFKNEYKLKGLIHNN